MQMERYRMNYCQNWWKLPESKVQKHRTELNDRASHSRYFSDELERDELEPTQTGGIRCLAIQNICMKKI